MPVGANYFELKNAHYMAWKIGKVRFFLKNNIKFYTKSTTGLKIIV